MATTQFGRQREKSADAPIKKSQKQEAGKQPTLDTLEDAAAAAAAETAVPMLTPAISCISFPGADRMLKSILWFDCDT